jgi:anti-sigma regulatory factor (Ser/Thr protein kinase)
VRVLSGAGSHEPNESRRTGATGPAGIDAGVVPAGFSGAVDRELKLDLDPSAPGRARRFFAETAREWRLQAELVEIAELVVSELVSNAVEHAKTASVVVLGRGDGLLLIAVRDASTIHPEPRALDATSFRGRGLGLIDRLSVSWGVQRLTDGKSVWAILAT